MILDLCEVENITRDENNLGLQQIQFKARSGEHRQVTVQSTIRLQFSRYCTIHNKTHKRVEHPKRISNIRYINQDTIQKTRRRTHHQKY